MKIISLLILVFITISCKKDDNNIIADANGFVSAVDISSYPEIEESHPVFYDTDGTGRDFLSILKKHGVNTIRLRIWVNPAAGHSGFNEVRQFSESLKNSGFKIWLTLHYSDTWADPGHQQKPATWQDISYKELKDSVFTYTRRVVTQIHPDYIQIGNENNSGMLHPEGEITTNRDQFIELLQQGISAVRQHSEKTKIILHFAGIEGAEWFFDQVRTLDYDIIGLSYYPLWHGKSLLNLQNMMTNLSAGYQKDVIIAETAYPFTLLWNDWTNNIVGEDNQLILPDFPATPQGQKDFIAEIRNISQAIPNGKGIGFCYWGAELIAWKGNQSTTGSPWENQALFDFQNKVLPVLDAFTKPL